MIISSTGGVSQNHNSEPAFTQQPHLQRTTALGAVEVETEPGSAFPQTGQQLAVVSTPSISLQEVREEADHPEPRIDNFRDATPCEKAKYLATHPMTIVGEIGALSLFLLFTLLTETDSNDSQSSEDEGWNKAETYGYYGGVSFLFLAYYVCLAPGCDPREGPLANAINLRVLTEQPESDTPPVPTTNNPTQVTEGTV